MHSVRLTNAARQDLENIWIQIARSGGLSLAEDCLGRIESKTKQLADFPLSGPSRPDIAAQVERWLLLYRIEDDSVIIVRVVDGARDLSAISFEND